MKSILVLLQKDFGLFFKDKPALLLTFLVPFVLIYIFGNIFGGSGDSGGMEAKIKLAVLDLAGTASSIALVQSLEDEEGLTVISSQVVDEGERVPFTEETLRQGIVDHDYNFAVIVPVNFIKEDGIGLRLSFISNPRNDIEIQMVNGLLQKVVFTRMPQLLAPQMDSWQQQTMGADGYDAFNKGLADLLNDNIGSGDFEVKPEDMTVSGLLDQLMAGDAGGTSGEGGDEDGNGNILGDLLEIEEDQVYGKEIKNPFLTRMIGGYAIMFLLFATTASATSLFEERNEGLFLRLLSMPVKRTHILWSKYLFNLVLGVIQVMALFLASSLFFDIDVFGNFFSLLVVCLLSASVCTAFGMLLSAIAKTPQQAQGLGTLLILGMTSMSGAWIPMQFMPETMQMIGKLTPVYWSIEGFSRVLWEGANLTAMTPTLGVIVLYSLVLMTLAIWRFKKGELFN